MRELEASLQRFGEFLLEARLVREKAAPYCVRWVRHFLRRPASNEPVADQVRGFCEDLEREGVWQDWQIRQAEQALCIYFVNFLRRTDWHRGVASAVIDPEGRANPLAALDELRCGTARKNRSRNSMRGPTRRRDRRRRPSAGGPKDAVARKHHGAVELWNASQSTAAAACQCHDESQVGAARVRRV